MKMLADFSENASYNNTMWSKTIKGKTTMTTTLAIFVLALVSPAQAARTLVDECIANLVFIGTLTAKSTYYIKPPGASPIYPEGLIGTRYRFKVLRTIRDDTGDTNDGIVIIHQLGGTIGTTSQLIPENPTIDVGDRYSFASRWNPGAAHPINLSWAYVSPDIDLPSEEDLVNAWETHCGL